MSLWYCSEHKLCNYQCCEKATTPVTLQDCDSDDKAELNETQEQTSDKIN